MNTKEMNNLKVGDYVRTKNGIIGEYISDDNEYNDCIVIDDSKSIKQILRNDIKKSSPNIINLIEVGDLITYKKNNIYIEYLCIVSGRYNEITKKVDLYVNDEKLKKLEKLKEIEILSVVTQEQLDDRSYKV